MLKHRRPLLPGACGVISPSFFSGEESRRSGLLGQRGREILDDIIHGYSRDVLPSRSIYLSLPSFLSPPFFHAFVQYAPFIIIHRVGRPFATYPYKASIRMFGAKALPSRRKPPRNQRNPQRDEVFWQRCHTRLSRLSYSRARVHFQNQIYANANPLSGTCVCQLEAATLLLFGSAALTNINYSLFVTEGTILREGPRGRGRREGAKGEG